ncbi:ABC transporter ATP-binding protein [Actinotalea sp. K2]|uniref:ABC transporter ATP-binding protein n=1 Tax=Actinotalea sp. K2 TaxID=2939438 RepID=UPI002017F09B|nr:ABC transporter ATP-binding protein [Actinotalea sp. K2]MCL3861397.1 ABC transporter ATP-binding protein [Actinotalea sp. K2]
MAAIEVEDLRKRYGGTVAVDGVSFAVERGEIFGVLGRNGAGKTTTVECLVGLRKADSGRTRVLGLDPHADRDRLRQVVGVQLQQAELHDGLRVLELVRMYRSFYPTGADPEELVTRLGLWESRRTPFAHLSGGQAQRLSIALALVGAPRVAVLDELTTGLDSPARRDMWGLVEGMRDDGVTVVLVTHIMEEAERLCDRIAVMHAGKVVALDTPAGLVDRADAAPAVSFRVHGSFEPTMLTALASVHDVDVRGEVVHATGHADLVHDGALVREITDALEHHGVVMSDLRTHRPSLDDAFLAMTED